MSSNVQPAGSVSSSSAPAATPSTEPSGRLPAWVVEVVLPIAAIAALFLVWEVACRAFAIPSYIIPAPSAIWTETSALPGNVAWHTLVTTKTVLLGFLVSLLVSLPLAVLLTSSPLVAAAVYPLLVLTQAIPKVALAPILVVVLGTSELPRVVVTFLVAFFPLVLSIASGLVSVPPELIELGRACRANRWTELWRIRLPYRRALHLQRPQGRDRALRRRRRGGRVRQCRRRPRLPDPDLDGLLQGAARLGGADHPVDHGHRAVPDRGCDRAHLLPVVARHRQAARFEGGVLP